MSDKDKANKSEIEKISLSLEEVQEALMEAKKKKWSRIKNEAYWEAQERGNKLEDYKKIIDKHIIMEGDKPSVQHNGIVLVLADHAKS